MQEGTMMADKVDVQSALAQVRVLFQNGRLRGDARALEMLWEKLSTAGTA